MKVGIVGYGVVGKAATLTFEEHFDIYLVTDKRGSKYINQNNYEYTLIDVPNLFSKLYLVPFNYDNPIVSVTQ